ncbi:hypothetical protein F5Y00DRAFT_120012 [Daldinia vernicosa]|uniref:uncharacterized protein n=1 Tax=Daldinia vernicosa TaxID=114800 RepID=UPI002007AE81|nr:uncharacterized protein F5Y00DRAFT_120012 [Daldinia vernicosa]KAI0847289.1 hypothetical protein F5Y00DRAFT_120012 [Daldinia vernicosa]
MEPLTFVYGEDDDPPAETTPFIVQSTIFENKITDIFRRYLQTEDKSEDSLSLTSAAQAIIELLPDPPDPRGYSMELSTLWELCIETAQQIPYYHICQMKLARLLLVLQHSPKTAFTITWDRARDIKFTYHLNLLKETSRDIYDPAFEPQHCAADSTPEDGRRWVNTVAFYAHMYALSGGTRFTTYCTWTMHDAFMSTASTKYDALDCHISAAAQWILCAGQNIFSAILIPPEEEHSMVLSREPWTLGEWRRWKAGFAAAEAEENLQQETRQLAKRSIILMEALEATMISGRRATGG